MRKEYEMSKDQLKKLMIASNPTPAMMIGDVAPRTPQENANAVWEQLGKEMGFKYMTIESIPGEGPRYFTAEEIEEEGDESHQDEHPEAEDEYQPCEEEIQIIEG